MSRSSSGVSETFIGVLQVSICQIMTYSDTPTCAFQRARTDARQVVVNSDATLEPVAKTLPVPQSELLRKADGRRDDQLLLCVDRQVGLKGAADAASESERRRRS